MSSFTHASCLYQVMLKYKVQLIQRETVSRQQLIQFDQVNTLNTVLKCHLGRLDLKSQSIGRRGWSMEIHDSTLNEEEMLNIALALSRADEEESIIDLSTASSTANGESVRQLFDDTAFPDVEDDELQLALAVSMSLDQEGPPQQVKPEGKI